MKPRNSTRRRRLSSTPTGSRLIAPKNVASATRHHRLFSSFNFLTIRGSKSRLHTTSECRRLHADGTSPSLGYRCFGAVPDFSWIFDRKFRFGSALQSAQISRRSDPACGDCPVGLAVRASGSAVANRYPKNTAPGCPHYPLVALRLDDCTGPNHRLDRDLSLSGTDPLLRLVRDATHLVAGSRFIRPPVRRALMDRRCHGGSLGRTYRGGPLSSFRAEGRCSNAHGARMIWDEIGSSASRKERT